MAAIPDEVTAGLPTVGLRMPAHPLALALIRAAGVPIAAPSANRFTELSATSAEHVRRSLGEEVDLVLDGGSTPVGIESTVLSLCGTPPLLLRPGMISRRDRGAHRTGRDRLHTRAPAPMPRRACIGGPLQPAHAAAAGQCRPGAAAGPRRGAAAGVNMPVSAPEFASALYATLHSLDEQGYDWIGVEAVPDEPAWAGIADRLRRAAARE